MSRTVRSVALILGATSFLVTATSVTPALAAPDQATPSGNQAVNNQTLAISFTATLPQVFGGFQNTDRVVMYIPNDEAPTLAPADADSDNTHDCLENPPIQGPRCYVDNVFTQNERTDLTLVAQFPVNKGVPSNDWQFTSIDTGTGTPDTWTCTLAEPDGCFTLVAASAPTVTSVTMAGGASNQRGQGSGPIDFTVTGTNFTPGIVVAERTDLADVTVTSERISETEIHATLTVGAGAPVSADPLRLLDVAGDGATITAIDIVSGPKITSFTPASIGRGATNKVLTIAGTDLVPGTTTFSTEPASGVTISAQSVTSATAGTITVSATPTTTPGNVPVTAFTSTTGGRGSANLVINPDVVIDQISPGGLRAGGQNKTVTLTGTGFRSGLTVSISNTSKVAFNDAGQNLQVNPDGTSVSFEVDVQPGAVQGDAVTITVDPNDGGPTDSIILAIVGTPTVTSYEPTALGRGAVNAPLKINGTNLDASATYQFEGAGLTAGPCRGSTTQITCETDVAQDAALTARNLTITSAGEDPTVIQNPKLGINDAPTITALTDAIGQGAIDHPVTVEGAGYTAGATLSATDLTVEPCTVSAAGFSCEVALAGTAPTGTLPVTVINGDFGRPVCGAGVCDMTVNAAPTVSAIVPAQVSRGANPELVLTGEHLAATTVLTLGNGISVEAPATVNAEGTQMTVDAHVAPDAALTSRPVTVVNTDGGRTTSAEPLLDVLAPPVVTSIAPTHIGQGADDATVRVTGVGLADNAVISFGTGTTTVSVTPVGEDHTTLDVVIDVAPDAPTGNGAHDLTATNPDTSVAMLADALFVDPLPTITSLTPATIGQGAEFWPIHVTGTGFLPGAVLGFGDGVLVNMIDVTPTSLDALVTIAGDAVTGERDASVTNDNAGAPGVCAAASADCLTVSARPTLTSLSPNQVGAGASNVVITATGDGLVPGASLDLGDAVTAVNKADTDATHADVEIDIDHDATTGPLDAVLINGDGGRSAPVDDSFTILTPPTIGNVSPRQVTPGANTFTITGTDFDPAASVTLGPGITVTTTTVTNGGTTMTVQATLADGAAAGIRDVRLTNPNLGADRCLSCLDVGDPALAIRGSSRGELTEGAVLRFFDRVGNVAPENVFLREASGALVPTTMSCRDLDGNTEPCATSSDIRSIELTPTDHLVPGERYVAIVNPASVPSKVHDTQADLSAFSFAFTAIRTVQENSPAVDHAWQTIRDNASVGDRYVREFRGGASMAIRFVGDDVIWSAPVGPAYGRAKVLVDGVTVAENVDTSAANPGFDRRFSYSGFGAGNHTLTIVVLGKKGANGTGTFVGIDAIHDDRGRLLNPGGRMVWDGASESLVTSRRVAVASLPGEKADLPFRGTGLRLDLIAAPDGGIAQILVDGFRITNANLYSASRKLFKVNLSGLRDQRHTLTVVVTGGRAAASRGTVVRLDQVAVRG